MKEKHRFDDLTRSHVSQRGNQSDQGWRALFHVRSGDLNRVLRSLPIVLPLVAALLVLVLSAVNMRIYHQQALDALELQAEGYALGMNRFFEKLKEDARIALASLDGETQNAVFNIPDASVAKLVRLGSLGIADKDNPEIEKLRHVERDMLRRSLDLQGPILDAYSDGTRWTLSLAQPVEGIGVLLVSYPEQIIRRELSRFIAGEPSALSLRFNVKGGWRDVAVVGEVNTQESVTTQAPLKDPQWAVQVGVGEWVYSTWIFRNLWLYVVAIIALAAVCLQLILALHRMRQRRLAMRRNAAKLVEERISQDEQEQDFLASVFSEGRARADESGVKPKPTPPAEDSLADETADETAEGINEASIEDDEFLDVLEVPDGAAASRPVANTPTTPAIQAGADFPGEIFRAYDIRGHADAQLTSELCRSIGLAVGAELKRRKQSCVLVARDGRNSSPRIRDALVDGLLNSGIDVTDLGAVPTPLMHFATHELAVENGLMITGSHNGRECNGVKLVMQGKSLTEDDIHSLRSRIVEQRFAIVEGERGRYTNKSIADRYVERVCEDVVVARRLKVVVDGANGITGPIAPRVFQALGCVVEPLYCELDGDFPNHDPDPTQAVNLHALQAAVRAKRADVGIAFDGDGDRVVFVTSTGEAVYPDEALMMLAKDVVARNPGATVVYDVKCSSHVPLVVSEAGGVPVMCRSGHSYVKSAVEDTGALLGGEFTGHIFVRERWYGFDDGIYVAARMLELLSLSSKKLHQMLASLPASISTPELLVATDERQKFVIIEQLKAGNYFADAQLNMLDGIRAEFPYGWGLVRASNTGPALSLRFEADTEDNLVKIQKLFRQAIKHVDPTLAPGF